MTNINCIGPTSKDYDEARIISNARFNYKPELICFCEDEDDVKVAIARAALQTPFPGIRIRAGGHHHVGMCSGNDVMMIDVSKMCSIDVDPVTGIATVGPGAKNGDIYQELWKRTPPRVFPGGGCGDVRVGGFLQGGGWGPYSRALGMGCDRVVGFRIVLANGDIWDVDRNDPDPKKQLLYWCVLGAGGGNFGVVTQYRIQAEHIPGSLSSFTVAWDNPEDRLAVMKEWRSNFLGSAHTGQTSFCRVSTPSKVDPAVLIGGNWFAGPATKVVRLLEQLLPKTISMASSIRIDPVHAFQPSGFTHPEYQLGPPPAALQGVGAGTANLADTCAGNPFPHMVSSCFPTDNFGEVAMAELADYIARSEEEGRARRYLSMHAMGGAIDDKSKDNVNCFPWRHKPFMLQYQAWWADPKDTQLGDACMQWLRDLRDQMRTNRYTEGAFINFPDDEIKLEDYYGKDTYGLLKKFIEHYDEKGVFCFPMGIPRPEKDCT
jgi:hypothetical protein